MKITYILCSLLFPLMCFSQQLQLQISNPQPRIGEAFTISIGVDTIAANLFSSLSGSFKITPYRNIFGESAIMGVSIMATKIGKNEVGPLNLTINGMNYTTTKIDFEVLDSLPAVNKGIWIRSVKINDSSKYIIIEQRIPSPTLTQGIASYSLTDPNIVAPPNDEVMLTNRYYPSQVIIQEGNHFETDLASSVPNAITKEQMPFKYLFSIYTVTVTGKQKHVTITKNDFRNLPDYYQFKDININ